MPYLSKGGGSISLARAQKLGIRTSRVSSWSRGHSFDFAVRATIGLIIIIIAQAFFSFTIILSQIDFRRMSPPRYDGSSPRAANSPDVICSSRQQQQLPVWRDEIDRYFSEAAGGRPSFAVVLTLNNGFWDFFVNWRYHYHFYARVESKTDRPLLILIAEDSVVYEKLKALPRSKEETIVVLPGRNFAVDSASKMAEDYDSKAYKKLVSSRATYLLNLMCSLEEGEPNAAANEVIEGDGDMKVKKENLVIVYSDLDTVWLKDPFKYIQTELFGSNNKGGTQLKQQPNYDILAAVDDHNYNNVTDYYCTGYLAIAQTPASFAFLSQWEKGLQTNPQLNQPLFNSLLRSEEIPDIRHGGLGESEFPPGRLYFDEWEKLGGASNKLMKKKTMVVHNNYIIGHDAKKERFQEHGLWMKK